jgi:hypothetical protein
MGGFAAMVTPLTNLLQGLSKHDKEGRLLLCGLLPPAAEEARKRAFAHSGQTPLPWKSLCTRQTSSYLFTSLSTA